MPPAKATLLAIDPSSSRTGYALFDAAGKLIEFGVLTPDRMKDAANDRIRAMSRDMRGIIAEHAPLTVVIEDTSGKVGKGRHKGNGAGLSIYGKAIGYMLAEAESCSGASVVAVLENVWTRGVSKARRIRRVIDSVSNYDAAKDGGGDMADAILLGRWFIESKQLLEVA